MQTGSNFDVGALTISPRMQSQRLQKTRPSKLMECLPQQSQGDRPCNHMIHYIHKSSQQLRNRNVFFVVCFHFDVLFSFLQFHRRGFAFRSTLWTQCSLVTLWAIWSMSRWSTSSELKFFITWSWLGKIALPCFDKKCTKLLLLWRFCPLIPSHATWTARQIAFGRGLPHAMKLHFAWLSYFDFLSTLRASLIGHSPFHIQERRSSKFCKSRWLNLMRAACSLFFRLCRCWKYSSLR